MLDKIGQEITVGCFIAYGHNLDRSAGLRIGRVEAVHEGYQKFHEAALTVLGVDDDWDGDGKYKPRLLTKRSSLLFPNRTVVLQNIPEKYKKLYEKDCVANGGKHTWKKTERLYGEICSTCGLKDSILD